MSESSSSEITQLLIEVGRGESAALQRLIPLIYDELLRLARSHRFRWRGADTPGTRSLVHEAYLKLIGGSEIEWQNRHQFFYLASKAMRTLLIDNARAYSRQKRGGGQKRVDLEQAPLVSESRGEELLAVDEALGRLGRQHPRLGKVVECRFFGGLSVEETAKTLDISMATVKRDWRLARAFLHSELER